MSLQNVTDIGPISGYGSSDETASLLVTSTTKNTIVSAASIDVQSKMASINGPTSSSSSSQSSKPVLIRQDRTSTYLVSPNLSQTCVGSEESGTIEEDPTNMRSITDIDVQSAKLEAPVISVSNSYSHHEHQRGLSVGGYQLSPHSRCRVCRSCDRRASTTPVSSLYLARSLSKESVRSAHHAHAHNSSGISIQHHIPPVLITSSPQSNRIIRQSSQPEQSSMVPCGYACGHSNTAPSVSLRQLRDPADCIAGIAADSLRINGAMRPFKQVSWSSSINDYIMGLKYIYIGGF